MAKKVWHLPEYREILIYDAAGAEELMPYCGKYSVSTIDVRGESINILCFLRAMTRLRFWKGKVLPEYTDVYIRSVSPKVIITTIDNDPVFYGISKSFDNIKTIFLQGGARNEGVERAPKRDEYHVDYMLVFGHGIARYYSEKISGEVFSVGSLNNNMIEKKGGVSDGSVLFISQYRDKPKGNLPFYVDVNGHSFYYDAYYSAEPMVLRFINQWCENNKKTLKIAGSSQDLASLEREFFESILTSGTWEYIPRSEQYGSYRLVDAAQIVVSIDSTLGYESIGRGKRTACFFCRGVNLKGKDRNFGWPADLPNNGPFWTNDQDEAQFQRVMDYLNTVSDEEWEQTRQTYACEVMEFDPGNTRFVTLLDQLLFKPDIAPCGAP